MWEWEGLSGPLTSVLAFLYCDRIPDMIKREKERPVLAHGLSGFSWWSTGPFALGPEMRQHTVAGARGGGNLLTSWWQRGS